MKVAQPIEWTGKGVVMIDQRRLPGEVIRHTYVDYRDVAAAIKDMVIRGAPAIGVAAAMGIALGVEHSSARTLEELRVEFPGICLTIARTRPTAVDLFWAVERMTRRFEQLSSRNSQLDAVRRAMVDEACAIHAEKRATDEAMGRFGAELMPAAGKVMTQCNAGALATAGIGSALGVIRVAVEQGHKLHVLVPETRPYLQGSRLTAWELHEGGIPLTLITDNMVGHFMKSGSVGAVVVGADRIAANGDTANKIGTYQLAITARHHGVKFMVVAPSSTVDMATPDGAHIHIEMRDAGELFGVGGQRTVADGAQAWNPVFDVTPADLIDALVTERGVIERPDAPRMHAMFA
jgi:methylthioribose-1-phosphate isomerase